MRDRQLRGREHTNASLCCAVGNGVQQADEAAGVSDGLLVPNDFFVRAVALVLRTVAVFEHTEALVCLADRKNEEQGVGRAGHKGQQLGLVYAKDVMEGESLRQAQPVDEG